MKDDIIASLAAMGLANGPVALTAMSGGVSCDVWRADLPRGPVCVKQALPRLRVTADWRAPPERSEAEVAWFRLVAKIDPGLAPKVMGEDRARHVFAMEYLEPASHPLWKEQLAEGHVDREFAAEVGRALAHIHSATAGIIEVAKQFDNGAQFHALRLEPYLLFAASKHPDLAPKMNALVDGISCARIALMHGDVSPKNILCGPRGPVFLDAETACFGDPAFDLAFCLNHLLLKCVWHPEYRDAYLTSFEKLKDAYLSSVDWERKNGTEERTAALLPALLLARIDGKSPVEYIAEDRDKSFVRTFARARVAAPPKSLQQLADDWRDYFAGSNAR
jgi:aminoglycoside phosphotransferase (APT) family kinase protein